MNARTQVARRETEHDPENVAALLPPVDIYEDETGFTLIADLPGVTKERLGVKVNGDNLLIDGDVSVPAPQGMELLYAEILASSYRRSFTLSRELDASKIEANLKDGVLRLRIPKAEEARPRKIEITVSGWPSPRFGYAQSNHALPEAGKAVLVKKRRCSSYPP